MTIYSFIIICIFSISLFICSNRCLAITTFYASWDNDFKADYTGRDGSKEYIGSNLSLVEKSDSAFGRAIQFKEGSKLSYSINNNIYPARGSIEIWASPDYPSTDNRVRTIFFARDENHPRPNERQIRLWRNEDDKLYFSICNDTDTTVSTWDVLDWEVGSWHSVKVTWDSSHVLIYIDGNLLGKSEEKISLPSLLSGRFFIGSTNNLTQPFEGKLDELRITDEFQPETYFDQDLIILKSIVRNYDPAFFYTEYSYISQDGTIPIQYEGTLLSWNQYWSGDGYYHNSADPFSDRGIWSSYPKVEYPLGVERFEISHTYMAYPYPDGSLYSQEYVWDPFAKKIFPYFKEESFGAGTRVDARTVRVSKTPICDSLPLRSNLYEGYNNSAVRGVYDNPKKAGTNYYTNIVVRKAKVPGVGWFTIPDEYQPLVRQRGIWAITEEEYNSYSYSGKNLLSNSEFKSGETNDWMVYNWSGGALSVEAVHDNKVVGQRYVKLTNSGTGDTLFYQEYTPVNGEMYSVSFYLKAADGVETQLYSNTPHSVTLTEGWARYTNSFTGDGVKNKVGILVKPGTTVYMSAPQLERGSEATPYDMFSADDVCLDWEHVINTLHISLFYPHVLLGNTIKYREMRSNYYGKNVSCAVPASLDSSDKVSVPKASELSKLIGTEYKERGNGHAAGSTRRNLNTPQYRRHKDPNLDGVIDEADVAILNEYSGKMFRPNYEMSGYSNVSGGHTSISTGVLLEPEPYSLNAYVVYQIEYGGGYNSETGEIHLLKDFPEGATPYIDYFHRIEPSPGEPIRIHIRPSQEDAPPIFVPKTFQGKVGKVGIKLFWDIDNKISQLVQYRLYRKLVCEKGPYDGTGWNMIQDEPPVMLLDKPLCSDFLDNTIYKPGTYQYKLELYLPPPLDAEEAYNLTLTYPEILEVTVTHEDIVQMGY